MVNYADCRLVYVKLKLVDRRPIKIINAARFLPGFLTVKIQRKNNITSSEKDHRTNTPRGRETPEEFVE